MVTKDDERKALKKIQKIVSELGDDSYVATALAGTLEDAEHNIEDDACYSYKGRYETSQRDLARATADLVDANQKIKDLEATALSREQLQQVSIMARRYIQTVINEERRMKDAIIENCDSPDVLTFKDIVSQYKRAMQERETTAQIIEALNSLI